MRNVKLGLVLGSIILFIAPCFASTQQQTQAARNENSTKAIAREVHHQLVLLPFYSIFDDLSFSVNGPTVTLRGAVVQPSLKSDAEKTVKGIEGVTGVNDQIEVLPLSTFDNQIRQAEFRAIYGFPNLQKYAQGAVPPIHIIVNNGHVTLAGVVSSQADKETAGIRANTVPNVFSVANNLLVESGK